MRLVHWAGVLVVVAMLSAAVGFTGFTEVFADVFQLGFYVLLGLAVLLSIVGGLVHTTLE